MGDAESQPQRESFNAFVGRQREVAELRAGIDEALAGRGRLFLVSGEPGIGKTRLGEEISKDAAARGIRVVWGRCWEGGGAPAYWPFVQVLRALVEGARRSDLVAKLGIHVPEIARIHPELYPEPVPESSPHLDPEQARFRLFDAVATLVRNSTRAQPLVMIIDDLHDADQPSVQMLTFVARALKDEPILIIGTYRDREVRRSSRLLHLIGELRREGVEISLSGLDEKSVASLIQQRLGLPLNERMAAELHSATAGNPLFVDAVVRVLASEGKLTNGERLDLTEFKVPDGVREPIRRRLARLSAEAKRLLEVAAALGNEFDLHPVAGVLGTGVEKVVEALDAALDLGVIARLASLRYRFSHALVRATLYDEIPAAERIRLHRAIGESLEDIYRNDPGPHLAELAYHFREGAGDGAIDKAIDYSIRAATAADNVGAYENEYLHLESTIRLLPSPEGKRHAEILIHVGRLASLTGRKPATIIEYYNRAIRIFESLGDRKGEAAARLSLGLQLSKPDNEQLIDVVRGRSELSKAEEIFERKHDVARLSEARMSLSLAAWQGLDLDRGIETAESAMELAEPFNREWIHSSIFCAVHLLHKGRIAEAFVQMERSAACAQRGTDLLTQFRVALMQGNLRLWTWQPQLALRYWAEGFRNPPLVSGSLQHQLLSWGSGLASVLIGELAEARRYLNDGPRRLLDGQIAFYAGDWGRAEQVLKRAVEQMRSADARAPLCDHLFWSARQMRAGANAYRADALLREGIEIAESVEAQLFEMLLRPELASLYAESGRTKDAFPHLLRCQEILAAGEDWRAFKGHVERANAVVAATEGNLEEGLKHFDDAVTVFRRYTLAWEEAETLHYWGRALLNAGEPARAIEKCDAAIDIYRSHGAGARWIERVEIDRKRAASAHAAKASATSELVTHRNGAKAIEAESCPPTAAYSFRREAEYWTIGYEGKSFRLRDSKGLAYIVHLLHNPAVEFHVIELVNALGGGEQIDPPASRDQMWDLKMTPDLGDAGPMLDPAAKAAYKRRLEELREELAEARELNDPGRAETAEKEIEFLTRELARAVGFCGRDRKAASHVERSRVKVTKAIRVALSHIAKACPELGRHLNATIKTGEFCVYTPDPRALTPWQF